MPKPATRDLRYLVRQYFLVFTDLSLLTASLLLYIKYFYVYNLWPRKTLVDHPGWYILLCVLWIFYSNAFKLYSNINAPKTGSLLRRTALVAVATAATYMLIPFLGPVFPSGRLPFFIFIAIVVVVMTLWHLIFSLVFRHPILAKRVLIVGAGWSGREITKVLTDKNIYHQTGYDVVGFIDDDTTKIGESFENAKVLGDSSQLFRFVRRLKIDEIILAAHTAKTIEGQLFTELINCESYGVPVTPVQLIYESVTGKLLVKDDGGKFILTYDYYSKRKNGLYLVINRGLNIIFGLLGVAALVGLVPFVFLFNLMFSRGPLFYSQIRVGRDNRPFRIYKFRTMVVDAEKGTGAVWASTNDPRITIPGRFYRRTRIDELPQFWNVLKGEMNLIGPRPERPEICLELSKMITFFNTRHLVKPGITGWAQVRHKYGNTDEDALIKLQYDLYYIKYRSLLLDFNIIWQTFAVMLKFKGN